MSKSYRSDPRNHIGRTLEIIKDFRGWISANGFSKSALIKQRTSHVKLPKIVILFDEQITFSKTLCKQAILPIVIFYQEVLRYLIVIFHYVSSVIFVLTFATFIRTCWLIVSILLVGPWEIFYSTVFLVGRRYGSNAAVLNTPSVA